MMAPAPPELTELILPLKERMSFLGRCLKYHGYHKIIAVDSSAQSNAGLFRGLSNVEYHHTPDADYFGQCRHALQRVKSPYTTILADDDFTLLGFISDSVKHLEKNPSIAGVIGHSSRFFEDTFTLDLPRTAVHLRNLDFIRAVPDKNVTNGYGFFVRYYFATFHSVLRSGTLMKILDGFERHPKLKELNAADRAFLICWMPHGGITVLDEIAHMRSSGESIHALLGIDLGGYLHHHLEADLAALDPLGLPPAQKAALLANIRATDTRGENSANPAMRARISSVVNKIGKFVPRAGPKEEKTVLHRLEKIANWGEALDLLGSLKAGAR